MVDGEQQGFIPILKSTLPLPEFWLSYLEIAYADSKFSNFGRLSHLVEERIATLLGVTSDSIVTCVNATQALTGAVSTAPENEFQWTIPSWTFTATASAMVSANKDFFFSDVDLDWRVNPERKDVNVVDVLPFGDGIDIQRLESLSDGEVVIDAAASFDALRHSSLSSIKRRFGIVVSFHPTKFPAGPEGSVFITNDRGWAERFRHWTIFGMDESRQSFFAGTNAKLNEFSSAVILASLDRYESSRREILANLEIALAVSKKCNLEVNSALSRGYASPYWIIKATNTRIQSIEKEFSENYISTRRWWMYGCHQMPAYSKKAKSNLRETDTAAQTSLGLPMYSGMSEKEFERIEKALSKSK